MKSLANQKVILVVVHGHEWASRFGVCLWRLGLYDAAHNKRIIGDAFNSSGANITNARNESIAGSLERHDADWYFLVDTDMTFDPDIVDRLVKAAHPEKRPIMSALCFSLKDGTRLRPTTYCLRPDNKVGVVYDYPRDEVFSQIGGQPVLTGTGCVLIHRSVFEKVRDAKFSDAYPWFQETAIGGMPVGEDITFFVRAMSLSIPVHIDSRVKTGHEKPFVLSEQMYEAQQAASHPVDVPTFVICPFKDKHDLTAGMLASLENQGYADVLLFDNGSVEPPPVEWNARDAKGMSLHEMWNAGVDEVLKRMNGGAANILLINNDVTLGRGTVDQLALALRSDPRLVLVSPCYDDKRKAELASGTIECVEGICAARYDGTGGFAGFCFMVKSEWFQASGDREAYRFPEEFEFFWGDNDIAMSINRAGGLMGIVGGTHCVHVNGGGQTPRPEPESVMIRRDGERFKKKWGLA